MKRYIHSSDNSDMLETVDGDGDISASTESVDSDSLEDVVDWLDKTVNIEGAVLLQDLITKFEQEGLW